MVGLFARLGVGDLTQFHAQDHPKRSKTTQNGRKLANTPTSRRILQPRPPLVHPTQPCIASIPITTHAQLAHPERSQPALAWQALLGG